MAPPSPHDAPDNPWRRQRQRRRRPRAPGPPPALTALDGLAAATSAAFSGAAGLATARATRRLLAGHHLWLNPRYLGLERLLADGLLPQVWPPGWETDAPVVRGPWGIRALDVREPLHDAGRGETRLLRARHAHAEPTLFVAWVRGRDPWAMLFWADAALDPAGCLTPRLQLRLDVTRVQDVALICEGGSAAAELVVFNRHPLGPRRASRYRLAPP